jgi:hypothetical protein
MTTLKVIESGHSAFISDASINVELWDSIQKFALNTLELEVQEPLNLIFNSGSTLSEKLSFEKSGFDTKHQNGFDTRGFDTQNNAPTAAGKGLLKPSNGKTQGIVNSIPVYQTPTRRIKIKRKQNRKKVVSETHFEHDGVLYEVMTRGNGGKEYGIYSEIMYRIIEQMRAAFTIHKRLFVQHIVLSVSHFTDNNQEMTKFRKSLIQLLKRKYSTNNTAYSWAREVETAKQQHYHLFVGVDGQKINSMETFKREIGSIIQRSKYFTKATMAGFHRVDGESSFRNMIYHASYLAKTRGKGYRSPQAKDYGSSRLKTC